VVDVDRDHVEIARAGHFPLVLGGDHSIAMGTVAGLLDAWGDVGVLWIDAHGDINTPETTPSGNVHGMPVAAILGQAGIGGRLGWDTRHIRPERLVLFGTRTLDPGERTIIRELGIRMFTMSEIDQRGVLPVVQAASIPSRRQMRSVACSAIRRYIDSLPPMTLTSPGAASAP